MSYKTTNGLMKHLRKSGIDIKGGKQKRDLENFGYYHAYKGYRFFKSKNNLLPLTNFNQIKAIYTYDMELKALFYRWIIFLETAMKNIALQEIIEEIKSEDLNVFFSKALNDWLSCEGDPEKKKRVQKKSLDEIQRLHSKIHQNYGEHPVITHYINKNGNVPLWAVFEVLSMGDFGHLIASLKPSLQNRIAAKLGINAPNQPNGKIFVDYIFLLKDVRNTIAHNGVLYDGRTFQIDNKRPNNKGKSKNKTTSNRMIRFLENETKIKSLNFKVIEDILILMCFLMRNLSVSKTEVKKFANDYILLTERFKEKLNDAKIASMVLRKDTFSKAKKISSFL